MIRRSDLVIHQDPFVLSPDRHRAFCGKSSDKTRPGSFMETLSDAVGLG